MQPANPPSAAPLDLDALERLAATAKAEIAQYGGGDAWVKATTLTDQNFFDADAEFVAACSPDVILALVAAARRGVEDAAPNYEAAQREFHRVTAYWAPEWVSDSDMFAKMLDTVLAAARAHPEDTTNASL